MQGRTHFVVSWLGRIGRTALSGFERTTTILVHMSRIWSLFLRSNFYGFIAPLIQRTQRSGQLFRMMSSVGVLSFPIVALISFLMGAILVLQSGEPLKQWGQLEQVPGAVALTLTREIAPLLTAIIMTARVGASFTAVLASMKINEEIMALETMAIRPVSYLVAPRYVSMLVMLPCLTMLSYLVGMAGGALVAKTVYDISYRIYIDKTILYLDMTDVVSGLVKAGVFGVIITMVCCYFGLITEGGPVGLGRNIMVAVVTALVLIIVADALATAVINNYIF